MLELTIDEIWDLICDLPDSEDTPESVAYDY